MELNDEGAAVLAAACELLQGPAGTALTPEQCKFVNADFVVSWLVSCCAASNSDSTTVTQRSCWNAVSPLFQHQELCVECTLILRK